jgi:hypothetical protein
MEKQLTKISLLLLLQVPVSYSVAQSSMATQTPDAGLSHPWDTYKLLLLGFLGLIVLGWFLYIWAVIRLEKAVAQSNKRDDSPQKRNEKAMPHYSATEEHRPSTLSSHLLAVKANRGSKPSDPTRTQQSATRGNP